MNNNQIKNSELQKKFGIESDQNTFDLLADKLLASLDIDAVVPVGLVDKVIDKKEFVSVERRSPFDFSKYLQIAAVFAAAICVGIVMGKHADLGSFNKKQIRKEQALIELRERHHLSDVNSFGRL